MGREKTDASERRKRLLEQLRACVTRDGEVPGVRRFAAEVGEKKHTFEGHLWASWGDFLREAGFAAGEFQQAIPDDDLLRHLAEITRQLGRFPSNPQLRFASKRNPLVPSEKTFRKRFGGQPQLLARLRQWVEARTDYPDVLAILRTIAFKPTAGPQRVSGAAQPSDIIELADSYVPPVVACLPGLANGDTGIVEACRARGLDPNVEFERRVGVAFRLLGFEVDGLGQGAGRVADGIAKSLSERWAVIYDAKVRRGGFSIGTEDRKFREYIDRHAAELHKQGFVSVYFAVVSSRFDQTDIETAQEIVRLTKAKAFALVDADALRSLVELKLSTRLLEDWPTIERVFGVSGIVGMARVAALRRS